MSQPAADSQRGQNPSPLQAVWLWLLGIVVVIGGQFSVLAVAALLAVRAGLAPEQALRLLSDPQVSPLATSSS